MRKKKKIQWMKRKKLEWLLSKLSSSSSIRSNKLIPNQSRSLRNLRQPHKKAPRMESTINPITNNNNTNFLKRKSKLLKAKIITITTPSNTSKIIETRRVSRRIEITNIFWKTRKYLCVHISLYYYFDSALVSLVDSLFRFDLRPLDFVCLFGIIIMSFDITSVFFELS